MIGHFDKREAAGLIIDVASRVARAISALIHNENLDLYLLASAAFLFTLLGATGVASNAVLSSITVATLATLALSQARSRSAVRRISTSLSITPLSLLQERFPDEVAERRRSAADYFFVGVSMQRTVTSARNDIRRIASAGGRVRVLLVDPANSEVLHEALHRRNGLRDMALMKEAIRASIAELEDIRAQTGGKIDIRVSSFVPTMGFNGIDLGLSTGYLSVQHFEYRPRNESAPIIQLRASDGYWFQHYVREAERMWEDGTPWPPLISETIRRLPHPEFTQEFGSELQTVVDAAHEILITGVARNEFLRNNYGRLEAKLRSGCTLRVLLVDPDSNAVDVAARRYYASRSASTLRSRIQHSLELLADLGASTQGRLEVRCTSYVMAAGIIAVDYSEPTRTDVSSVFVEYYTYQAPGEPKFVLSPAQPTWFANFLGEAEKLWESPSFAISAATGWAPGAVATLEG